MDIVQRLQESLEGAMRRESHSAAQPLTIADLYQRLVPYRTMRTELGVMELAAYEHALLRLLGGEGEHVRVESAAALEEFRRELASPNPILGIYRDYSDVPVTVGSGAAVESIPTEPFEAPPAAINAASADAVPPEAPERSPARRVSHPGRPAAPANPPQSRCRGCSNPLPLLPGLRFCPYCGENRPPEPCAHCGTLLELGWNFCIRCGNAVAQAESK